jgi:hypothetical protein
MTADHNSSELTYKNLASETMDKVCRSKSRWLKVKENKQILDLKFQLGQKAR